MGLEPAYGEPFALVDFLREHESVWDGLVARHGLRAGPLRDLMGKSHHYADLLFGIHAPAKAARAPVLVSTIKLRQAGFGGCIDTEAMFAKWLGRLAERRVIPTPG